MHMSTKINCIFIDIIIIIIVISIFSSKQCRGFRGLVDHMHRDHSDYKPWQCSHCPTKTAFVKTLYRYIRPNVSLTWPNKYDEFYISALTVLQKLYLLKLFLPPPRVAEVARRAFDKRLDSNKQTKCLSRNICYFFSSIKISCDILEDFGQKM